MASFKAMELTVPTIARIGIDNILGEQKKNRDGGGRVFYRIRKKMLVDEAFRQSISKPVFTPQGLQSMVDLEKCEGIDPITVTLEAEEVTQLYKFFDSTELPVAVMDWSEPLMEQIEAQKLSGAAGSAAGKSGPVAV